MSNFKNGFNGSNISQARQILERTLKAAAAEHGLGNIELGRITYDSSGFRCKMEVSQEAQVATLIPADLSTLIGKTLKNKTGHATYRVEKLHNQNAVIIRSNRGKEYIAKREVLEDFVLIG